MTLFQKILAIRPDQALKYQRSWEISRRMSRPNRDSTARPSRQPVTFSDRPATSNSLFGANRSPAHHRDVSDRRNTTPPYAPLGPPTGRTSRGRQVCSGVCSELPVVVASITGESAVALFGQSIPRTPSKVRNSVAILSNVYVR